MLGSPSQWAENQRQLVLHQGLSIYTLGWGLLSIAYVFIFMHTQPRGLGSALEGMATNVLTAYALGLFFIRVVLVRLMDRALASQLVLHAGFAFLFSATWYGLIIVSQALVRGIQGDGYEVHPFHPIAAAWQIFQGLTVYAVVGLSFHLLRLSAAKAEARHADGQSKPAAMSRYLIRREDEMLPMDVDEIVSITGADDYSEVATRTERHLVRMSLMEFEKRLDPDRFLRVHRSRIINFDRLVRAEPIGSGRLALHMEGGKTISVSRSGAQRLRSRLV